MQIIHDRYSIVLPDDEIIKLPTESTVFEDSHVELGPSAGAVDQPHELRP